MNGLASAELASQSGEEVEEETALVRGAVPHHAQHEKPSLPCPHPPHPLLVIRTIIILPSIASPTAPTTTTAIVGSVSLIASVISLRCYAEAAAEQRGREQEAHPLLREEREDEVT